MFDFNIMFSGKSGDEIYSNIKGRYDDIEYMEGAKKALLRRGKWYGFALIDLIDAKLKINDLNRRIKELEEAS